MRSIVPSRHARGKFELVTTSMKIAHNRPMADQPLRDQLERFIDWEEAHVGFDKCLDGIPPDARGKRAPGFEHSIWQLLEHLRLAQDDILDFCVNAKYVHALKWPDDYWPKDPAPPSAEAWDRSIAGFTAGRTRFKALAQDAENLYALVPTGKDQQTYFRGLLLVQDHNAYHLGQIVALRKALGAWG
jgi:uncharacterized damage-inducible protein DinB